MVKQTTPKPTAKCKKGATVVKPSQTKKREKKLYNVTFFRNWCKSCGICTALCVKKIIKSDETGVPYIDDMDSCTGCRFCEIHCPDFAITIKERYPERRSTNGNK
jgi:2-oxoglutarate ferredoxin oxidoreductase subunit delta